MARTEHPILIRNAEVYRAGRVDVLVVDGKIAKIAAHLGEVRAARDLDAKGGALLPGLHDHHIHLAGLAVRAQSVWCGPPSVTNRDELADRLAAPGTGWIRGIGYHESVLGSLPDARTLDALVPDRPLRMQHRSGRMWLLNSAAIDTLLAGAEPPSGLEIDAGRYTGRLFDADDWLRTALGSEPPDFSAISAELARHGVTGLTDMTPQNGAEMATHFARQRECGALVQSVMLAGNETLSEAIPEGWMLGPLKLHLHEAELPPYDETVSRIERAHASDRPVAIHCVSEVEIVYALAALEEAGCIRGDRIEHASVALPAHVAQMASLGLAVCVQPHFVAERGDRYLLDVESRLHGDLYRLASLQAAGIVLAGGSDAPFGNADPWAAMHAAVHRKTAAGQAFGPAEALTAENALSLWLADPADFTMERRLAEREPADLCLLSIPWDTARNRLSSSDVVLTVASGKIVHDVIE